MVIAGLLTLCGILAGALVFSQKRERQSRSAALAEVHRHNSCHEDSKAVIALLSARVQANALRQAAKNYDSMDGVADLRTLARQTRYEGEPSLPAQWLLNEANKIDPPYPTVDDVLDYMGDTR